MPTTPRRKDAVLQIEDQLSDPETLNFWRRYFQEECDDRDPEQSPGLQILIDDFCDAIHQEFFSGIIANILDENEGAIDEETLVQEVNQELRLKLCLDEETVSINALELFTR